jgi:acetylglutamate kinase
MKLTIQKIGGKVIDNPDELKAVLKAFAKIKGPKILVHGGGSKASILSKELNIPVKMIEGRRVTTQATLDVVTMVYAGLLNKKIVSQLQAFDCNALGLTGADLNTIKAKKRTVSTHDYGFAGDIEKVNTKPIRKLLKQGITPVFCAITHDKKGQLLNTNADTITASLGIGLSKYYKVSLVYHFDRKGVLMDASDDDSVIKTIKPKRYEKLKNKGIIQDGMIPKIDNAFHALQHNVSRVIIRGTNSKGTIICL